MKSNLDSEYFYFYLLRYHTYLYKRRIFVTTEVTNFLTELRAEKEMGFCIEADRILCN